jgi:hypothetical protein
LGIHGERPSQVRVLDHSEYRVHRRAIANRVCPLFLNVTPDIWNGDLLLTKLRESRVRNKSFMLSSRWTYLGSVRDVLFNTTHEEFVHLVRTLHPETRSVAASEFQLGVDEFVGAVIVDENFCLLEVGSGGKRGIASLRCLDVMSGGVFVRSVKFRSGDYSPWSTRVGMVHDKCLSVPEGDSWANI